MTNIIALIEVSIPEIPAACAAGIGGDLLLGLYRATAIDLAEDIFLRLTTMLPPPTEETAANFAAEAATWLLEGIQELHRTHGFQPLSWTEHAEREVMTAYAARLYELISSSIEGGAA